MQPSGLLKALKSVLVVLWVVAALSQFGFWFYQEGYIAQAST